LEPILLADLTLLVNGSENFASHVQMGLYGSSALYPVAVKRIGLTQVAALVSAEDGQEGMEVVGATERNHNW
jgi:hypothetical protein